MTKQATLNDFTNRLLDAVAAGTLVKLTLSTPTSAAGDLKSIDIRPIMVKRELKLSFTHHHRTNDVVKNHPPQEAVTLLVKHLEEYFRVAQLQTTRADFQLMHGQAGYTMKQMPPSTTQAAELSHDRAKQRMIETKGKAYLHALGITDAKGEVYKNAQDKFRQIDKYIELLNVRLQELPLGMLRIVDMGAGKGYLTFALYDYVVNNLKREVEIIGVEYRADLVEKCNCIAQAAGFKGLRFVEGSIAEYDCCGANVVIALHACDTATDDAIAKAVKAGAALIVVAPCCHKQIRKSMGKMPHEHALAPMLQYGTYVERMAEMVTDALRAQLLELSGYKTNLFEFISDAHTPKNVMIVAVKTAKPANVNKLRAAIARIKAEFGIAQHYLESLL